MKATDPVLVPLPLLQHHSFKNSKEQKQCLIEETCVQVIMPVPKSRCSASTDFRLSRGS